MGTAIAILISTLSGIALSDIYQLATSKKAKLIAEAEQLLSEIAEKANLDYNEAKARIARKDTRLLTIARDSNRARNFVLDEAAKKVAEEEKMVEDEYRKALETVRDLSTARSSYAADPGVRKGANKLEEAIEAAQHLTTKTRNTQNSNIGGSNKNGQTQLQTQTAPLERPQGRR